MNAPTTETRTAQDTPGSDLWVLEGTLDLPVFFPRPDTSCDRTVRGLFLDFSGRSGDGLIELRAQDKEKINQSVWWSRAHAAHTTCLDKPRRYDVWSY